MQNSFNKDLFYLPIYIYLSKASLLIPNLMDLREASHSSVSKSLFRISAVFSALFSLKMEATIKWFKVTYFDMKWHKIAWTDIEWRKMTKMMTNWWPYFTFVLMICTFFSFIMYFFQGKNRSSSSNKSINGSINQRINQSI